MVHVVYSKFASVDQFFHDPIMSIKPELEINRNLEKELCKILKESNPDFKQTSYCNPFTSLSSWYLKHCYVSFMIYIDF